MRNFIYSPRSTYLCISILFVCSFIYAQNDCPSVSSAQLADVVNDPLVADNCQFKVEVEYQTGNANNSSLLIKVQLAGSNQVLETTLLTNLPKNITGNWTSSLHSLNCSSLVDLLYSSWNNPSGNDDPCAEDVAVSTAGALPVELVRFEGNATDDDRITLEWVTASEDNNDYFEVQHSTDGKNFLPLTKISGQGTTQNTQYYRFDHLHPVRGNNYYRLLQVDFDGGFELFDPILVKTRSIIDFDIYPSHAYEAVTFESPVLADENMPVNVVHTSGKLMLQEVLQKNSYKLNLDIAALPAGTYYVHFVNEDREFVSKPFVKVRD